MARSLSAHLLWVGREVWVVGGVKMWVVGGVEWDKDGSEAGDAVRGPHAQDTWEAWRVVSRRVGRSLLRMQLLWLKDRVPAAGGSVVFLVGGRA